MPRSLSTLLLLTLFATTSAQAKDTHALRGLFCNNPVQLAEALDRLDEVGRLSLAVALTNRTSVVCTFAYSIRYVVHSPVIIGGRFHGGDNLTMYEASLVGVLVGDNPRPIEPPITIYFVPFDPVPRDAIESRT